MDPFTIAAAQTASVRGDVPRNLAAHVRAVHAAAHHGVRVLVFPELSLTGYEPTLASALAFQPGDTRLAPLAQLARNHRMTLIVGAPLATQPLPHLGAITFDESGTISTYAKIHLHGGEERYFSAGSEPVLLHRQSHAIGVAICADLTRPSHPRRYAELRADIYAAGVCITPGGYDADAALLRGYAAEHGLLTVMANHNSPTGGHPVAGRSAVWVPGGALLAEAGATGDALVIATHDGARWQGSVAAI